jgi:Tol biopolymer transport system component/DNA-binding winged helix-turn-helix (wHTH) protein
VSVLNERPSPEGVLRFGGFELDVHAYQLRKSGRPVRIQPQPARVLAILASDPGRLITREELHRKIWDGTTFVDFEQGLNFCIRQIRLALDDDAQAPRFIETVPRRGYRFLATVASSYTGNGSESAAEQSVRTITNLSIPEQERRPVRTISRPLVFALSAFAALALALAVALLWSHPASLEVQAPIRLTSDSRDKWGNLSDSIPSPVVTDGTRLYLVEPVGSVWSLAQASISGGDTVFLQSPFRNVRLTDTSPDRTRLLIANAEAVSAVDLPFYTFPTVGGSAQRLGDFLAHDASFSPDGSSVAYANSDGLFITGSDGMSSRRIVPGLGAIWWPRWSPDGTRLRFTVTNPTHDNSIWEVAKDASHLVEISKKWKLQGGVCCGSWVLNGAYFVFQSDLGGVGAIWAAREHNLFATPEPQPITAGPVSFSAPTPSPDGKRLFAVGVQFNAEAVRFDPKRKQFNAFLPGSSPESLDFSRDGRQVTYVQHQGNLWRARPDGTDRLQLTSGSIYAILPRWSPDGLHIAFFGGYPHRPIKLYMVSANGGSPEQLISDQANEGDPSWSPDGRRIAFGRLPWMPSAPEKPMIFLLDLKSRNVEAVAGSQGLFSPRWSPTGDHLAALSADSSKLMLYDFAAKSWRQLAQGAYANPDWSHDGAYVYAEDVSASSVVRVRIRDASIQPVMSLNPEHLAWTMGRWTGIDNTDNVVAIRDLSTQELYSLDVRRH